MTGTESDLLKQATQAMMARYAGKRPMFLLRFWQQVRSEDAMRFFGNCRLIWPIYRLFFTELASLQLWDLPFYARVLHLPGLHLDVPLLAHAPTSKLARGPGVSGLIDAAIGDSYWAHLHASHLREVTICPRRSWAGPEKKPEKILN